MFDLSVLPPPLELLVRCVVFGLSWAFYYVVAACLFHYFRIHERFGLFHTREPNVHFYTSLRNWRVPFLWAFGVKLSSMLLGLDVVRLAMTDQAAITPTLPPEFVFIHSPNRWTDVLIGLIGFYVSDFLSWVMHWLNHKFPLLYKKFPVAHFVHHNMVFLNPLAFAASPLVHLVAVSSLIVAVFMLSQGLVVSAFVVFGLEAFGNLMSHLGCDPLPWLSRLNHRMGGWLPWIPVQHQYHHLPFVGAGNYGNRTCLWDYVFGTVIPESVYHIEHGHAQPEIAARMANADVEMERFLRGKSRLNMA